MYNHLKLLTWIWCLQRATAEWRRGLEDLLSYVRCRKFQNWGRDGFRALCSPCPHQRMISMQRDQVIFCNEGLGSFLSVITAFCSRSAKVFYIIERNTYLMKSPFALMWEATHLLCASIWSVHREFKTEKKIQKIRSLLRYFCTFFFHTTTVIL